MILYIIKFNCN